MTRRRATRARASRPARHGPTCPTTGPAPTAASATRSTSSPRTDAVAAERIPYATAARELLRTTLLDAARELLRDRPWNEVTMAQVAQAAGVSRQTLYNEFGSREEFAQAFVLREGDRFLAAVEA